MMRAIDCVFILLLLTGCAKYPGVKERSSSWALPAGVAGMENCYRVSPGLYRSGQITALDAKNLENLGVKTVVSLRSFHSDRELLRDTTIAYERISFETWNPEREELVRFLKIVTDPARTPVLVHCWHGSDRTGAMCAAYRVVVQGWSKEEAIREMKEGGYGHHKIWGNLPKWIGDLAVEELRAELR